MSTRSLFTPLLATLALAAVATPAESRAAAAAPTAKAKRPLVSPRPGQVVRSHHVWVRVRSRTLEDTLRVRLNGTQIGDDFGRPRRGMRTLRASLSHGLRRGRNVLRVTVRSRRGTIRRTRAAFVVRTRRHLVGAGQDRELAVDGNVRIRGAVRTRPRGDAGAKLRWRLVRAPRRSPAHDALLGGEAPHVLSAPGGPSAGFRPRVPGSYTLRLSAGGGSRAASDTVTFEVSARSRLVSIATMTAMDDANGDQRGIRVGDTTYLLRDAKFSTPSGSVLQVLVLKRKTLEFVSNRKYLDGAALAEDLRALDNSHLVILVLQPGGLAGFQYGGLDQAVGRIGVPDMGASLPKNTGLMSAIGVPGMAPGDADVNILTGGTGPVASMKGYLTPDQWGNYGFVPSERKPFSFAPKPAASCKPASNGGRPCIDGVGFRIRHLDARTLAPAAHDGGFYAMHNGDTARQMAADLAAMPDGNVVMIEAVSNRPDGQAYFPPVGAHDRATMVSLATEIAQIGGTRNAFNRIVRRPGSDANGGMTYALVGWKGAGEGHGVEAAAGVDGEGEAPSLEVVLRPDRQSRFRPVEGDTAPDALTNLFMEEPTAEWPLDDEPGPKAALAWLGSTDEQLGSDPRAEYANKLWGRADWDLAAEKIRNVDYSQVPDKRRDDFTREDFLKARGQLLTELDWVGNVRSYLSQLKSPIEDSTVLSYAKVQTIADTVYKEAQEPEGGGTMEWIEFAEILLDLGGPITHEVSSTIAGVMELGVWAYGTNEGGSPSEEIPFEAHKLGSELTTEMAKAAKTYKRMGDVIVTDPAKLAYVGTHGDCSRTVDTCPEGYSFGSDDADEAFADIQRAVERLAYEELLPIGFHVYGLNVERLAGAPDPRWYRCAFGSHPWWYYSDTAVSLATTPLLLEVDPQNADGNLWKLLVLARPKSSLWGTAPSDTLLKRVFGKVEDSTDPRTGGLGVSPARLMSAAPWHLWYANKGLHPTDDLCS